LPNPLYELLHQTSLSFEQKSNMAYLTLPEKFSDVNMLRYYLDIDPSF